MDIFVVALLVLLLVGIQVKREGYFEDSLSPQNTNQLRGIFALVVILHHLSQRSSGSIVFPLFAYVGYLAVSVFFFISGYGLMTQYQQRQQTYAKTLLTLRIPSVLIPYLITTVLYSVFYGVMGETVTVQSVLFSLVNGSPIALFSWYIIAILCFYFLFYLATKLSKGNRKIHMLITWLGLLAYIILCMLLNYGSWWYNSCFAFGLGVVWAVYHEQIMEFFKRRFVAKFSLSFVLFLIIFSVPVVIDVCKLDYNKLALVILICQVIASLLFSAIVALAGTKVQFKNRILSLIGDLSLEIYLIQGIAITLLRSDKLYLQNSVLYTLLVFAITAPLALLLHIVFKWINTHYKALVNRKRSKISA